MDSQKSISSRLFHSGYIKTIILAVIIVGAVFAFWFGLRAFLRTEYPFLTVASGSMRPTLNVGDLIVVQGFTNATDLTAAPKPTGDIVVFRSPRTDGELIVHRAVEKQLNNEDGFWYVKTQGDANMGGADYWTGLDTWNGMISQKLLVGKVVGQIPWLGYVPLYIRTPFGVALVLVLILVLILVELIPEVSKKRQSPPTSQVLSLVHRLEIFGEHRA